MTAPLECVSLAVGRGTRPVLAGVDLVVQQGERLALLGENGCGKTTLLRALAGLDRPIAGEVRWQGGPLPRGSARASALGVLLQSEHASRFAVEELVTLGLALDGPASATSRLRVEAALARVGLTVLARRPCASLSGGEAQRALLARALVAGPSVLLLDEPTNHLDPARQAELFSWLDALRGSVAVVIASHDLALAASCDRVALLHAGRIAVLGSAHAVLTPENLARTLGVIVRRVDDPAGGPPWLRVVAPCTDGAAA